MKKLLKNKKGFSLIELLIVMAILAIIAAIAINLFGGIIGNTKEKADQQTAKTIKKSVTAYIAASGDKSLYFDTTATPTGVDDILVSLQSQVKIEDGATAITHGALVGTYGPYLENPAPSVAPVATSYDPQYNADQGGTNAGWNITVHTITGNVEVKPDTADAYTTTAD